MANGRRRRLVLHFLFFLFVLIRVQSEDPAIQTDSTLSQPTTDEEVTSATATTSATNASDDEGSHLTNEQTIVEGADNKTAAVDEEPIIIENDKPVQRGPLIDLFGQQLLSLEMISESSAQLIPHWTSDVLRGKNVIGVYFSADWCGPCRKFTPELVAFYKKVNSRRGKKDQFEIVWVSRCRDVKSFGQYFTHMGGWYALPPEEAMGERGAKLAEKFKVKSIPHLVLLDDLGNVITYDARNKIPQDKAGIGFPWRNPLATLYMTLVPRSLRLMVKSQLTLAKDKVLGKVRQVIGLKKRSSPLNKLSMG
jgi:thiol-disulfide isomerase/thioredoxin